MLREHTFLKMQAKITLLSAYTGPLRQLLVLSCSFLLRALYLLVSAGKPAQLPVPPANPLLKAQLWRHLQEVSPPFGPTVLWMF